MRRTILGLSMLQFWLLLAALVAVGFAVNCLAGGGGSDEYAEHDAGVDAELAGRIAELERANDRLAGNLEQSLARARTAEDDARRTAAELADSRREAREAREALRIALAIGSEVTAGDSRLEELAGANDRLIREIIARAEGNDIQPGDRARDGPGTTGE